MPASFVHLRHGQEQEEGPDTSCTEAPRAHEPPARPCWTLKILATATAAALVTAALGTWLATNGRSVGVDDTSSLVLGYKYVEIPNTGCNNWEAIEHQHGFFMSLEDCKTWCTINKDCYSINYQAQLCDNDNVYDYCILFDGECEQGPNTCTDPTIPGPSLWIKQGFFPEDPNETECSLRADSENMAIISLPSYKYNRPFQNFSDPEVYECISWTVTTVSNCVPPCAATGSLRAIYPKIVGTPVCGMVNSNLANPGLISQNCSRFSDVDATVTTLATEITQVCGVGNWYGQLSVFYNAIVMQQQEALQEAQQLLDMKASTYVQAPAPTPSSSGHHWVKWLTGTMGIVTGVLAFSEKAGIKLFCKVVSLTSTVLGDSATLYNAYGPSSDNYNPQVWEEMKILNDQAADAAAFNKETLVLEDLYEIINLLLRAVEGIFSEQMRAIVADAGKLTGASQAVTACLEATSELVYEVANAKSTQLWRSLVLLMPLRYAIYMQRDMAVPCPNVSGFNGDVTYAPCSNPSAPCYTQFAIPMPTYGVYSTSNQTLDWCDTQFSICEVSMHESCRRRRRHEYPDFETTPQCQPSSRRIWLSYINSPSQLVPDSFWRVLGSPLGLLPSYISPLYGLNISVGAEAAWQTMLGQCANMTRSYQPSQSGTCSSDDTTCGDPWAPGLQGDPYYTQTVGWTTIASAGTGYKAPVSEYLFDAINSSDYSGMLIPSTQYGICDVFGIPLHVYPLPDCNTTETFYEVGKKKNPDIPTCINGFSVAAKTRDRANTKTVKKYTNFVQLSSFNQYGLVPKNCPDKIVVEGLAWFDIFAMGLYAKQPWPVIADRPVYRKADHHGILSRWIYFSAENQSWIVGARVIRGPGITITPAVAAGDEVWFPSDTSCPYLGFVHANEWKPEWLNTSLPFWSKYALNEGLDNVSNSTLILNDPLPDPYPEQAITCCVPWRTPPDDCEQAVCDCNALYGIMSVGMITTAQYQCWLGKCADCAFYGGDGGVQMEETSGGDYTFTGGCSTMTSAGPLKNVLVGNINSTVPACAY